MQIAVLIPAHDEADRIGATVSAASRIEGVTRIVVVDDASSDETAVLAERAGAKVVRLTFNVGKGAALDAGASRVEDADIVLLLDGDLGEAATQGGLLLAPVLSGSADVSIAKFPRPAGRAGFGLVKGLARWGIARMGGGFEAQAPLSGQRALTCRAFDTVRPFAFGYGVEVAMTVRALRAGLAVVEVETTMSHAATGRDVAGFVHRGRQFVHVCIALIRLAFEKPSDTRRGSSQDLGI